MFSRLYNEAKEGAPHQRTATTKKKKVFVGLHSALLGCLLTHSQGKKDSKAKHSIVSSSFFLSFSFRLLSHSNERGLPFLLTWAAAFPTRSGTEGPNSRNGITLLHSPIINESAKNYINIIFLFPFAHAKFVCKPNAQNRKRIEDSPSVSHSVTL